MVHQHDHFFGFIKRHVLPVRVGYGLYVLLGQFVVQRDLANVMKQSTNEVLFPDLRVHIPAGGNQLCRYSNTDRMSPESFHVESLEVTGTAQGSKYSGAEGQIFYRIDAQHYDGPHQRGNLIRKGIIRRVDQPHHFSHEYWIETYNLV